MRIFFVFFYCFIFPFISYAQTSINNDCTYKGIPLYGAVKVVENGFADFEIKKVNSFGELKVKKVHSFATTCGEWQFVKNGNADFTVKFVDAFGDFTIQFVDAFPGLN